MIRILDEVKGAKTIGISGHIRPDGDCVGSVLALYQYLKKELPASVCVDSYLEKPSEVFSDLAGIEEIKSRVLEAKKYDVFIALDCEKERLGEAKALFETAQKTINIDHHISNTGCGTVNVINPFASSTSELVYEVMEEKKLDREIAKALYVGIIHDTGVFQYSNTSPRTMEIASRLLAFGFDFSRIIEQTFYEKSYVQNQIMGRALLESILFMDGKCIVSGVDKRTMDFYGVTSKDLDGIVNQMKNTKGVECAVFMYETDVLEHKVSMRSTDKVDVSRVASFFGGGGHKKAAGCNMSGTFHDVINNLSLHIEKQLKEECK